MEAQQPPQGDQKSFEEMVGGKLEGAQVSYFSPDCVLSSFAEKEIGGENRVLMGWEILRENLYRKQEFSKERKGGSLKQSLRAEPLRWGSCM